MCMEDIILGRAQETAAYTKLCTSGVLTTIAGPNPKRTRITISTDGNNAMWIGIGDIVPASSKGIALTSPAPFYTFTVEEHGNGIQGPILAIATAGDTWATVIDVFLQREK